MAAVTPAQHLLAWFTPARRQLLNGSAIDRLACRPINSFTRFLAGEESATLERVGLRAYYPVLQLVGYLPPGDVWVPERELTAAEASSDIREWFTPERRQLIRLRQVDEVSGRPFGILSRYLNNETHLTFKIIGIDVYYPALQLLGFEPAYEDMITSIEPTTTTEHLLLWFTPERRRYINSLTLDLDAGQPEGTLSQFLAGYAAGRRQMAEGGITAYYPALAVIGYHPDLDLSEDASVQRHLAALKEQQK